MRKAGIDFGLTHVKAHWIEPTGQRRYLSTMDGFDRRSLSNELWHRFRIDALSAAGNGPTDGFERFAHHRPEGDPLSLEISTQAAGAARLLEEAGVAVAGKHLIVAVGTGTSYALQDGGACLPLLGSAVGAGTVDGLLASMGMPSGPGIDEALDAEAAPPHFDLMLAEAVPSLKGTPYEAFVASHFAKAARDAPADQAACDLRFAASAVNLLLVDVARSLLLFGNDPLCSGATDVVVLGTMPTRSRVVRRFLEQYLRMIGKNPIFPPHAEYALAVGAYHASDLLP